MEEILHTFGIDWRLLLINAINFGLLLAGLTFFLYKPLGKMLRERQERIAKGVKDAEAAEQALLDIEESRKETLAKAGEEADSMLAHTRATAQGKAKEIMHDAEAAAARLLSDAEKQGGELKQKAIQESKEEVARMIVLGIEKLAKQNK